ncbi:multiprotein-bridging factor 1 family protein [Bacteroidota bacterium]
MKNFSDIVKNEREKRGWILRKAAAELDIDQAIISKIEKNQRKATREQVEKFSKVYNLDLNDLLKLWLSDKIIYEISEQENPIEILKIAEKQIKYNKEHSDE